MLSIEFDGNTSGEYLAEVALKLAQHKLLVATETGNGVYYF